MGWSQQFDVTEVMTGDKGRAFCFIGHCLQMAVQCQLITARTMALLSSFHPGKDAREELDFTTVLMFKHCIFRYLHRYLDRGCKFVLDSCTAEGKVLWSQPVT